MGDGVEIRLLGRFSVRRAGEEVPPGAFRGRLVRSLIRVLLTRRGSFVAHDVLAEALWPGRMPADPAANLKVLVSRARAGLGDPALVVTGPGGYSFAAGDACQVDAEEFLEAAARGQRHLRDGDATSALRLLTAALERWAGEPLAEDAYEDWARDYRAALGRAHVQALEDAARAALFTGDPAQAVALAGAAAALEPLREGCHLVLAEAQAAAGDTVAALRTIDSLRRRLGDEVGLEPSKAVLDVERQIQRGAERSAPTVAVPIRAARPDFAGLAFVGRSREMAATLAALTGPPPGVALVAGAAGAGKSRLLSEVAARFGLPVLSVRAFQAERDEPWALARSLLREALGLDLRAAGALSERMVAALLDVVPELEDVRPSVAEMMDAESRRALALEGAVRLLATAAEEEMLLVLDDLQSADSTSLLLLGLIGRRVPQAALALGYRPADVAPGSPLLAVLDDLDGARTVTRVDMRPFSAGAVGELLADPGLAETITQETDGTPFAVVEVIRRLSDEGAIGRDPEGRWRTQSSDAARLAAEVAREGQLRNIERRAMRQGTEQRETLALLALLGREAPARLLAAARNTEQSKVLDNLDALARAGLARLGDAGWATAHDLVAETVAGALPREERGRLHHHLARALDDHGEDPAERAHHLA
ncbi:MAG: BTAD domain-containing putative transcriptional regulator, partial [Acidimicrobiia bacterium]